MTFSVEGFFSPDRWIEHHWICEGVEDRYPDSNRRKPLISELPTRCDKLTPQRKSFAAGCGVAEGGLPARGGKGLNGMDFRPSFVSTGIYKRLHP